MKKYITIKKDVTIVKEVICDKCGKIYDLQDSSKMFYCPYWHIEQTGCYGSKFPEDETVAECDLCEKCAKELLGEYCKNNRSWV